MVRQLRLLGAIHASRQGLTVRELAANVEDLCAERTLYRDLVNLQHAGYPLYSEEGRWRIDVELSLPQMRFEEEELLALHVCQQLVDPQAQPRLAQALKRLRDKALATLGPQGLAYHQEVRRAFVASHRDPVAAPTASTISERLEAAIVKEQQLRIVYAAPEKAVRSRIVEPYGTWFFAGGHYLVARCPEANDIRKFALQRIREAEVLDETFDVDEAFDMSAYIARAFNGFHGEPVHVVLVASDRVAHLFRERAFHASQRVTEVDGGVRVELDVEGLEAVARWLAGFGGEVKVGGPSELEALVYRIHQRGLDRNA